MSDVSFGPRGKLQLEGALRRVALVGAGCATYKLGIDHHGEPRMILCLCCGIQSFNSHDIVDRYCGICSEYHTEWVNVP